MPLFFIHHLNSNISRNTSSYTNIDSVEYTKGLAAIFIMLLNVVKLILIKFIYGNKLIPYSLFMINFSFTDFIVGLTTLMLIWTNHIIRLVPNVEQIIHDVNILAKCGLFSSFFISFIHLNLYEVFRMYVVSKPFVRLTVTTKRVMKFIFATWFLALSVSLLSHISIKVFVGMAMMEKVENLMLSIFAVCTMPNLCYCVKRIHTLITLRKISMAQLIDTNHVLPNKYVINIGIGGPKMRKRTGIVSLILFFLFWTPFVVCSILALTDVFENFSSDHTANLVHDVICFIPYLNCIWNPLVYISSIVSNVKKGMRFARRSNLRLI